MRTWADRTRKTLWAQTHALLAGYCAQYNGLYWGHFSELPDGLVASWPNLIPGGAVPTAAGTTRPTKDSTGILFDGVNDVLTFSSDLSTPSGSSLFLCANKVTANGADLIFQNKQQADYTNIAGIESWGWTVGITGWAASNIVLTSSMAIIEAVIRNFNDIDVGVNGTVVTQTTGLGYRAIGAASIGGDAAFGQYANTKIKEVVFLGDDVPAGVATNIRNALALRNQVTL